MAELFHCKNGNLKWIVTSNKKYFECSACGFISSDIKMLDIFENARYNLQPIRNKFKIV